MSLEAIQDIMQSRIELAKEQRQVEAEAFAVMRTRPTFFALKLLFGVNHKGIEEEETKAWTAQDAKDFIEAETGDPEHGDGPIAQPA